MTRHSRGILLAATVVLAALAIPAIAQVPEIRLARQFSMGYLQFNVMEHQQLIEKHARVFGIPEVKVSWHTFNGPAALWVSDLKSKLTLDFVDRVVSGPQLHWTMTPENTMKFARFMVTNGMLREPPASWRDYFFSKIHNADGS